MTRPAATCTPAERRLVEAAIWSFQVGERYNLQAATINQVRAAHLDEREVAQAVIDERERAKAKGRKR